MSQEDGQLDLHLHRVSATDDGKGLNEGLLDLDAAAGTHIVSFGDAGTAAGSNYGAGLHTIPSRRHYEQVGPAVLIERGCCPRFHAALLSVLATRHYPPLCWVGGFLTLWHGAVSHCVVLACVALCAAVRSPDSGR